MKPSESPFPCLWYGLPLDNVGLGKVRPDYGTYGGYDFSLLPSPPANLNGSFDWLLESEICDWSIATRKVEENRKSIEALEVSALNQGLNLPPSFVAFFRTLQLQTRIRSVTDCYLYLCSQAVPIPNVKGHLIEFLIDSQGCLGWYLYINQDGSDHAVLCSTPFIGSESVEGDTDESGFAELVFCGESFESFLWRTWIENEIWLSQSYEKPINELGQAYIHQYLQNYSSRPGLWQKLASIFNLRTF